MVDEMREGRTHRSRLVRDGVLIGAELDAVDRVAAFQRRIDVRRVERQRALAREIEHQRFLRRRVAEEEPAGADQIRR